MITRIVKPLLVAGFLMTSSFAAKADVLGFDITLEFGDGLTESQQSIFTLAEEFWESIIIGYSGDIYFTPSLTITASAAANDGVGGVLGSAGPTVAYNNRAGNGLVYTKEGSMSFDSADIADLESDGTLFDVIVHEMAHVLGFGTLWELNGLYVADSGEYTGEYAVAAFQEEFDANATYVPVELDGGDGTANGHWDEYWGIGQSDLMTGYLEGETTLSATTIASFQDLGYIVVSTASSAVEAISDVPAPFIGGMFAFMFVFANRRKQTVM